MAKAHQALIALLDPFQEVRDVLLLLDPAEHSQHLLVSATVERPIQRGDAGRDRRVGVYLTRAHAPDRTRGAVLLVVGVKDEQHVERMFQPRIGLILELGHLVDHREEVARIGEVVVRIHVGHAPVVPVGEGRQRRHLRDQPDDLHVAALLVLDRARLGIEGRQRANRGQQHSHRVGVVAEALHELLDVLVHEGVDRDLVHPLIELLLVWQVTVDQEIGDLQVARMLGELLDRIAAVLEDPLLAVDERDRRAARRRRHVRGVVAHQAKVVLVDLDLAQLGGADRLVLDRNLVLLARAVVGDGQRVLGGGYAGAIGLLGLGRHGTPLAVAGPGRA